MGGPKEEGRGGLRWGRCRGELSPGVWWALGGGGAVGGGDLSCPHAGRQSRRSGRTRRTFTSSLRTRNLPQPHTRCTARLCCPPFLTALTPHPVSLAATFTSCVPLSCLRSSEVLCETKTRSLDLQVCSECLKRTPQKVLERDTCIAKPWTSV